MLFKNLEWDSNFFHKRIARLNIGLEDEECDIVSLLQEKECDYDLIYIFSPQTLSLSGFNSKCKLVDEKVIYQGLTCVESSESSVPIRCYNDKFPNDDLLDLAYVSSKYSRYHLDTHFAPDDYKRMYTRWMENSINGTMADFVLCAYDNESIIGMITLKMYEDYGDMGLVAVSPRNHGQGIGTALVQMGKKMLSERGIEKIEVATQLANIPACHFYERQGMQIKNITNVYHWWREQ